MSNFSLQEIEPSPEAFVEAVVSNPIDVGTPMLLRRKSEDDLRDHLAKLSPEKRSLIEDNLAIGEELAQRIGLVLLGKGADRTAFHDLDTDTVYKIAHLSKDPVGDHDIERLETALCQEYFPGFNIPTAREVAIGNSGRLVLLLAQPFIDLWQDAVNNEGQRLIKDIGQPAEVPDAVYEGCDRLLNDRGLRLDGCALQPDTSGQYWILDTTLVPAGLLNGERDPKSRNWRMKSWMSFDIRDGDLPKQLI